jgi:SAM-dependent methyltransferase
VAGPASNGTGLAVAGALNRFGDPSRPSGLAHAGTLELAVELIHRMQDGPDATARLNEEEVAIGVRLLQLLHVRLDVHENRTSRRRYNDCFATFHPSIRPEAPPVRDATYVDLGCGSVNPFALLFTFLALGARRGIAIDCDTIELEGLAMKHLADLAGMLLVDPPAVVGAFAITREQILEHLRGFDLSRLRAGDGSGVDGARLQYRAESVHAMSLGDGEADVVVSNAFLEHIDRVDDALAELARITRPGGFGVHVLDANDHRVYGNGKIHPLEFLRDRSGRELVEGSNRLRPSTFARRFEAHGFEVVDFFPQQRVAVDDALRRSFAPPFRSMTNDELSLTNARISVRRKG